MFSGSGGLHHLVDGADAAIEVFFSKAEGEVIDDL